MVAAPETAEAVVEMKTDEKSTIAEKKSVEAEKVKEDAIPAGSNDETSETDKSDKLEKASEKLSAGKKAFLQNLYKESVDHLAEACTLMSAVHGEMSPNMCDVYYHYGRALLELARIEEDVLGNALTGVPEADDVNTSQVEDPDKLTEEEKEKVAQEVEDALEENLITAEKAKSEPKKATDESEESSDKKEESEETPEGEKSEKMETEEKAESETNGTSEEKNGEETAKEEEDGEEEEAADGEEGEETAEEENDEETTDSPSQEEDVSSLQLAWEVLDLAKTIYLKSEDRSKEDSLKLSQVFVRLGEVSLENEAYKESISMVKECLKLQEEHLSPDDRLLAESYYQLGLAQSFDDDFDEALKSFSSAVKVIEDRIKNVTEKLEKDEVKHTDDLDLSKLTEEQQSLAKDLTDLKKLLPMMKEKIVDLEETKKGITDKIKAIKNTLGGLMAGSSSTGFDEPSSTSSEAKPISTSMIRKKRKPEDDEKAEESESKKAKTDENGTAEKSNGEEKKESTEESMETEKSS